MEKLLARIVEEELRKSIKKSRHNKRGRPESPFGRSRHISFSCPGHVADRMYALARTRKLSLSKMIQQLFFCETGVYSEALKRLLQDDEVVDPVFAAVRALESSQRSRGANRAPQQLEQKKNKEKGDCECPKATPEPPSGSFYLLGSSQALLPELDLSEEL